jgi:hypothetical protein
MIQFIRTATSVTTYMTSSTFFICLTIRLFYKYFSKSINQHVKSKVHWIIDIMIYMFTLVD